MRFFYITITMFAQDHLFLGGRESEKRIKPLRQCFTTKRRADFTANILDCSLNKSNLYITGTVNGWISGIVGKYNFGNESGICPIFRRKDAPQSQAVHQGYLKGKPSIGKILIYAGRFWKSIWKLPEARNRFCGQWSQCYVARLTW